MTRLLITVGTTRFDSLVETIFTESFLEAAQKISVDKIVLQHGHSPLPRSVEVTFSIEAHTFLSHLQDEIEMADIVIGHAGSGTVLDVLRGSPFQSSNKQQQRRPILIVVPNEDLMDNHQLELANQLEFLQCAIVSNIKQLPTVLQNIHTYNTRSLPSVSPEALAQIIMACE